MERRTLLSVVAMTSGAAAWPAAGQGAATRAIVERFAATLSAHDITAFAALFADDYVNQQMSAATPAPPAGKPPKQATVDFFAARLAGIPDLRVEMEAVVASADMVAASFVYAGTQTGPLYGVAPTGKRLRFTSCDIFSIRNERIAEHWGMGDIAGVLAQLRS